MISPTSPISAACILPATRGSNHQWHQVTACTAFLFSFFFLTFHSNNRRASVSGRLRRRQQPAADHSIGRAAGCWNGSTTGATGALLFRGDGDDVGHGWAMDGRRIQGSSDPRTFRSSDLQTLQIFRSSGPRIWAGPLAPSLLPRRDLSQWKGRRPNMQ